MPKQTTYVTETKFKGRMLRDLRIQSGQTLEGLASQIDSDSSSVSLWERGKRRPGPRKLRRISEFFKVPISAFFLILLMAFPAHADVQRADAIRTIVGEASNQGPEGMTAVGEVIRRRGSVAGIYGYRSAHADKESKAVWKAAADAWDRSAKTNLTRGATLFENIGAFGFPKSWDRDKVVCVAQIKDHWFFVEE